MDFVPLPDDLGDHERYITALLMVADQYPAEVLAKAIDPVRGIPSRLKVLRLASVREILDEINAPFAREAGRVRASEEARRGLPPPRRKRTPEEQARVDEQVRATRQHFSIPLEGFRRGSTVKPQEDSTFSPPRSGSPSISCASAPESKL